VRGYPTFKMVNSRGEEIERWIGYDGPEVWTASVYSGIADPRTLVTKEEVYGIKPTGALARSLANAAATEYDWKKSVELFGAAKEMDPARADEYNQAIVTYTFYGTFGDEPAFGIDEMEAVAKPVFSEKDQLPAAKLEMASMITTVARNVGEPTRAVPYLKEAMAASEGTTDEELLASRERLAVDHALYVEQDADKAVAMKRASMPEGWQDSAKQLNRYAWWCFQNKVDMEEGQKLALKGVELADSDKQKAQILDTAAELCNALGNCDEAVALIRKALELNPDDEELKAQLAKFEQALQEKSG